MTYLMLGLLFTAVFVFILWRIVMRAASLSKHETYVCPHCNEKHCICHKRGQAPHS
jgi:hypothetical protein